MPKAITRSLKYTLPILLSICSFVTLAFKADVSILESLKYLCYLFVFVWLPGWCLYRVLCINPGSVLRQFSLGLILGYVLEVTVYFLVPIIKLLRVNYAALIIIVFCIPRLYLQLKRKGFKISEGQVSNREVLFYVAIAILAMTTVWFYGISQAPLPSQSKGVIYYQDLVWHLSLAAEAKWHNPPLQNPSVSGEPLGYYLFSHIHMAMASCITGLELTKILLRLFPLELYFMWAFMLCWVGRELVGGWKAGVMLSTLVLLIGSLAGPFAMNSSRKMGISPFYDKDYFNNLIFWTPFNSPTFLFGTIFFISLMMLIGEYLKKEKYLDFSLLIIIIILLFASAFIKAVIVPMLIMGLSGVLFWELFFKHKLSKNLIIIFAIAWISYIFTKSHTESNYVGVVKIAFSPQQLFGRDINGIIMYYFNKYMPDLSWLTKIALPPFVIFGYAPLSMFGFMLLLVYRRASFHKDEIWPLCLFLIPFLSLTIFKLVSGGTWNILIYTTIPLSILSVKGLSLLFKDNSRRLPVYFAKSAVTLFLCSGLSTTFIQCLFPCINSRYYLKRYGDKPLLTSDLLSGLQWLRTNTGSNTIIAVNFTQELWKEKKEWFYSEASEKGKYWYYSAFSERRIFLEGDFNTPDFLRWVNIYKESPEHVPFADRKALLERFFKYKDKDALIIMKNNFRVSHLLVDKRRDPDEWLQTFDNNLIRLVYSNKDVDIYEIIDKNG